MRKILVIFWSGTGNTQMMAEAIAEGAKNDDVSVELLPVSEASVSQVAGAQAIALGCPSMGDEVLEEDEMEPFVESINEVVRDKQLVLFGSYDWGDGQWMEEWEERMKGYGANLLTNGLIVNNTPDADDLELCKKLGRILK